jgi:hypothetical protein
MHALPSLPRVWVSVDLPGRVDPEGGTYGRFAMDELPPIERTLDDRLGWLLKQPVAREWAILSRGDAKSLRARGKRILAHRALWFPPAFEAFISSPEPGSRIRSGTGCWVELTDHIVPVSDGGSLIRFLADQQGVVHWHLYTGPHGSEAVLAAHPPYGYDEDDVLDPEWGVATLMAFEIGADPTAVVCAESFSEFIYRYWIENEIIFKTADGQPLTGEQRRYVDHYHRR